jgi:hypothetical protein
MNVSTRRMILMNLSRISMLAAVALAVAVGAEAQPSPTPMVVMSGLDNPRGLAFAVTGHDPALYVAEAGRGGTGGCLTIRGQVQCAGLTGAVSRYYRGIQERVVSGLPSYAPASGAGATGPEDVSFDHGRAYAVIGLHGDPATIRTNLDPGFGWVVRFLPNGKVFYDTDIASFEAAANPDGGIIESNPHGLLNGAGREFVVDSGGNSLLQVDNGKDSISALAVFPSRVNGRSTDSVPSAVAVGPDGAYYVSELSGVPFAVGAARVYRVVPGQAPQIFVGNFTTIIDLDFDSAGNLYVLEHATGPGLSGTGAVTRVDGNGNRTVLITGLTRPTSVAIGPDCAVYVSNRGVSPGIGEVLRFDFPCL